MGRKQPFSHLDAQGKARMVDVSGKKRTARTAVAAGLVRMGKKTQKAIKDRQVPKGDVFAVARVAGIMAAKRTAELIPLCHPLGLDFCEVRFDLVPEGVAIRAQAAVTGPTGVEMEALVAVSAAALAVYDMCKSLDKGIVITDIMLMEKQGGKSGPFKR